MMLWSCLSLQISGWKFALGCHFFVGLRKIIDFQFVQFVPKTLSPWKKICDQPRQHIKKQRHYFADQSLCSQSYGFSCSHVWMWELDHKESWVPKNWCFWTVVLEKTLESPLDCKKIKPVHPKGNRSWIFTGRTDAKLKLQYFGHLICRTDSI